MFLIDFFISHILLYRCFHIDQVISLQSEFQSILQPSYYLLDFLIGKRKRKRKRKRVLSFYSEIDLAVDWRLDHKKASHIQINCSGLDDGNERMDIREIMNVLARTSLKDVQLAVSLTQINYKMQQTFGPWQSFC